MILNADIALFPFGVAGNPFWSKWYNTMDYTRQISNNEVNDLFGGGGGGAIATAE